MKDWKIWHNQTWTQVIHSRLSSFIHPKNPLSLKSEIWMMQTIVLFCGSLTVPPALFPMREMLYSYWNCGWNEFPSIISQYKYIYTHILSVCAYRCIYLSIYRYVNIFILITQACAVQSACPHTEVLYLQDRELNIERICSKLNGLYKFGFMLDWMWKNNCFI